MLIFFIFKVQEQSLSTIAHILKFSAEETENLKKMWKNQMNFFF